MLMMLLGRRTTMILRRPFMQRLILLVVTTLLAMGLLLTTCMLVLPQSGREVVSIVIVPVAHLGGVRMQELLSKRNAHGQDATEEKQRERRLV